MRANNSLIWHHCENEYKMNKLLWYDPCYDKCWMNYKMIVHHTLYYNVNSQIYRKSAKIVINVLINNFHHIQQFDCDDIFSDLVVNRKSKTFNIFSADNAKKHVQIISTSLVYNTTLFVPEENIKGLTCYLSVRYASNAILFLLWRQDW